MLAASLSIFLSFFRYRSPTRIAAMGIDTRLTGWWWSRGETRCFWRVWMEERRSLVRGWVRTQEERANSPLPFAFCRYRIIKPPARITVWEFSREFTGANIIESYRDVFL